MNKLINLLNDSLNLKNIDSKVYKLMSSGIKFSFILLLFSVFILSLYIQFKNPIALFEVGRMLFKCAGLYMVFFFICGITFNKLLGELHINHK